MLVQNLYNLAGDQHIREQPTCVVGEAEAREDRAADMLGGGQWRELQCMAG